MNIKKKLAGMLAGVMILNSVSVLGNVQERLPSDGISPIIVTHTISASTGDISPSAQVTFKEAPSNTMGNNGTNIDKPEAEYYRFILNDAIGGTITSNKLQADTSKEFYTEKIENHLENVNQFRSGALYKLTIRPGHTHIDDRGNQTEAPLSSASTDPVKFFLTDFNTKMKEENDEIVISWEYVPGATYKLVYIAKAASTKAGVDGTDGDSQTGVSSQTVIINEDNMETFTEKGVRKVKYTLPNTKPGQKYSAYVIATNITSSFLTDKFENVGKNTDNPKIVQAARSVSLKVFNIGRNRIELNWELGSWADNHTLKRTKIYRKTEGETSFTLIGTLNNDYLNPRDPGKFEHDEPKLKSTYYVEFVFTGATGEESLFTKEVEYTPYELREQPLKPQIPEPYAPSVQEQEGFMKADYLVKDDDIAAEKMEPNTFHVKEKSPLQVQLVWDAPKLTDGSIEHEMAYDIWVVEDEKMLEDSSLEPVISNLAINASDEEGIIYKQDNKTIVGFKTLLSQYTSSTGAVKNLISNKTYYIKMVAKRNYGGEYSISQPTIVAITIDKNGDIFTPPMLAKPPLRIQEEGITKESITIEWLEKWYEITANDPMKYDEANNERFFAKLWNSKVYTGGTPEIKFSEAEGLTEHILFTRNALDAVKRLVDVTVYSKDYRDREVTLGSDVQYEVKTLLYDDVIRLIKAENAQTTTPGSLTIEKWIVDNESSTTAGWNTINPGTADHKDNLDWKDYTVEGLNPNTRYIVLIRAYRTLDSGEKLIQTYPSYVIGTTASDYTDPEATPTVPNLNPNGVSDESVSVWWTYNEDFDYEIVYSRLDNPNSATSWPVDISTTPGEGNYVSNGSKAVVTITGLAPETTYNVWIRAKQKVGDKISAWSNPVTQTTRSIESPDAPRGLGPAAYQSILALGLDFPAVSSDYITVEWLKDVEDEEAELSGTKAYSYVIEFADNLEFLDAISFNTSSGSAEGAEILDKTMVRFTGLEANMPYYVRVKTVLTYTNPETGATIVKESEFTKYVRIFTKTSNGEYDGGENDNVVIYPEAVEETYKDGIWTYEIVDAAKITTQIQANKQYFYTITLENYKNKYDASIRRIKMPKKVLDTLINQNMALKIITNIGTYEIPGKALKYYSNQHSATDTVQFDLTRMEYSDISNYARSYPEQYESGEKLQISIKNSQINKLDDSMTVKLKLDVVGSYNYSNFFTYQYNYATGNWNKYNYSVDTVDNSYLNYSTVYTGLNAIYERTITSSNSNASYLMNELTSAYNITGLGTTYGKNSNVGASQYVSLLLGIRLNRDVINLGAGATTDDYAKAKAAGLYTSSSRGNVTKEQALAGIIKLYEINHGYQIKPSNMTFNNVSSTYREAASKAYAVGLIETMTDPQSTITYEELCDWIIQVIQ